MRPMSGRKVDGHARKPETEINKQRCFGWLGKTVTLTPKNSLTPEEFASELGCLCQTMLGMCVD